MYLLEVRPDLYSSLFNHFCSLHVSCLSTCSGDPEGLAACTIMACPPCEVTCEDNGQTYCPNVKFLSSDGCNQCECTETGDAVCTMMACPDEPAETSATTAEDPGAPAVLPNCGAFTNCIDCLNQEGCDAWSTGQCFPTCSNAPQDTSCYSQEFINGTPDAICMQADNDNADAELCAGMSDCTSCVDTVLSNGTSACQWFAEGDGYCASGCGMMGCGLTVCPAILPEDEEPTTLPETDNKTCSACEVFGIGYCVGDSFIAEDGCNVSLSYQSKLFSSSPLAIRVWLTNTPPPFLNLSVVLKQTCTCSGEDGLAACTMMVCEPCGTCVEGNVSYCAGQQFLAEDGCNVSYTTNSYLYQGIPYLHMIIVLTGCSIHLFYFRRRRVPVPRPAQYHALAWHVRKSPRLDLQL